jgi:hypothetical protein
MSKTSTVVIELLCSPAVGICLTVGLREKSRLQLWDGDVDQAVG